MPSLTIVVRALWDMTITVSLLLMGYDFSGGSDDAYDDEPFDNTLTNYGLTGFGEDDGVNQLTGECDGGLDPDGIYW